MASMYPSPTIPEQYSHSIGNAPSKYEEGYFHSSGSTTSPTVSRMPIGAQGTDSTPAEKDPRKEESMKPTISTLVIPLPLQSNFQSAPSMFPSNKATKRSKTKMISTSSSSPIRIPFAPSLTPTLQPIGSGTLLSLPPAPIPSNSTTSPISLNPTGASSKMPLQSHMPSEPLSMLSSDMPTNGSMNVTTTTLSSNPTVMPFVSTSTPTIHPSAHTGYFGSGTLSPLTPAPIPSNSTTSTISLNPTGASSKMPLQSHMPSEPLSMLSSDKPANGSMNVTTTTLSSRPTMMPFAPSSTPTLHPSAHTGHFGSGTLSPLTPAPIPSNFTASPISLNPTGASSNMPLQSHMPSEPLSMLSSDKPTNGSMNVRTTTLSSRPTMMPFVSTSTPTIHPSAHTRYFGSSTLSPLTPAPIPSNSTTSTISLNPTVASSKMPLQSHIPSAPFSILSPDKPTNGSMNVTTTTLPVVTDKPLAPVLAPTLNPGEYTWKFQSDSISFLSLEPTSHTPGSTTTANSNLVPSKESMTAALISSIPSATPSMKQASMKPTTSPSKIPNQNHSPSEASLHPITGSMNPTTGTNFAFMRTVKPSSGLTLAPTANLTFHPRDYAIQSDPLSLQSFVENSQGSVATANSTIEPSKLNSLIMRPALLSSLAVVVISIFALFVVIALKLNEKFKKQNHQKLFTQDDDIVYYFDTPISVTHDVGFSSNFYPQHQVTSSTGHLGVPDDSPNFAFDIFDCRQAMLQPSFREESGAFKHSAAESFNIQGTPESYCAETVVSNLTTATFPTNKGIEIHDCPTKIDDFDSNSSILTFSNERSSKKLRDIEKSNSQAYSGNLDQIIEESSSCIEYSTVLSDQYDTLETHVNKPSIDIERNDDDSLDSYGDLCSNLKNATATEANQVNEEHSEDEVLIELDSYSECGAKHQNGAVSKQVLMYENDSDDSEASMESYDASWAKEVVDKRVNRIATEILEDSSCLESQAETVDVNFEDERGFGSHYC